MTNRLAASCITLSVFAATTTVAVAGSVTGTVAYLERRALPPEAQLHVQLLDTSRADAPSVQISTKRYAMDKVPFEFELDYDDAMIDERFRYTVSAVIEVDGEAMYRSTTAYPVLTYDASNEVEVMVDRMPVQNVSADTPAFAGSSWTVTDVKGRLLAVEKNPTLTFSMNGEFSMNSGCNSFVGIAEVGEGTFSFPDNMASTMKACIPPYDKLEKDLVAAMGEVTGFEVNEHGMSLTNEAGLSVLRMVPAQ
ncbi:YbaY family lipoprotein (plasmid) [Falsihalocynthiibacter sp. SS001]|uniref:YbaY family lipoprotein n=1 Tax=Falsihalocynthiibacter sp. SS001 TaxID=3349698 RepID=UPI0036D3E0FC